MKKINVTVNYCDIEFQIKGYYIKGDDYDNYKSYLNDEEIFIQGIDVYQILSIRQWNDILDLAIEQIED